MRRPIDSIVSEEQRRVSIAVYFVDVLEAPEESEWDGHDGTVSIIQRELNFQRVRVM